MNFLPSVLNIAIADVVQSRRDFGADSWFSEQFALAVETPEPSLAAFRSVNNATVTNIDSGDINQYASSVIAFSSQYSSSAWSAEQALGQPNTFSYGDITTSWAPLPRNADGDIDADEFITVGFSIPVYANSIEIRETYGNGFVRSVELLDDEGIYHFVWLGTDPSLPGNPVNFRVDFDRTNYLVVGARINVDVDHDSSAWEEIDSVQLFGVTDDSTFAGTTGNDTLNGTTGADTLIGLAGNDTYTVNNAGDVVTENLNEGTDTVKSDITYTLPNNVEKLTLNGSSNLNGTGNTLNNTLTGNSGNNILTGSAGNDALDGKTGADTLIGGLGNDTFTVDNIGDIVTENPNEGTDTIKTSFTHTLGANFENLTLLGTENLNGTGNDANNKLTGNSGNNILTGLDGNDTLDGKTGADTMIGGLGNDTYTVDNVGDVVTENLNEGTDAVKSSINYTLGANLENLTLNGTTNLNGTGNSLNNKLTGNTGANILNGGAGADTLAGKAGNDTFVFRFGESTVTALDRVSDFAIGLLTQGGAATGAPAAFTRAADSATTNVNTIVANVFTDANGATAGNQALELNSAALVLAGTSTYLIVNDGAAGFQSANDLVINLTGITGTLPAFGSIPVGNFFV